MKGEMIRTPFYYLRIYSEQVNFKQRDLSDDFRKKLDLNTRGFTRLPLI